MNGTLAWGEARCEHLEEFAERASSIRFAGCSENYKCDSLTIYEHPLFMGQELILRRDQSILHLPSQTSRYVISLKS